MSRELFPILCVRCGFFHVVALDLSGARDADERALLLYHQLKAKGWDWCALQPIGGPPIDVDQDARWWCPACVRQANAEVAARRN